MSRIFLYGYWGLWKYSFGVMAAGAPVIAFGKEGVIDTLKCFNFHSSGGATGLLFPSQTVKIFSWSNRIFKEKELYRDFYPELISDWANSFSQDSFKIRFEKTINRVCSEHTNSCDIASSDLRSWSKKN